MSQRPETEGGSPLSNRDFWKVYGPLIGVALIGFLIALSLMDPAPPRSIKFGAGAKGGAYFAFAERYQALLGEQGVAVELVETAGSVDNLRLLAAGDVDAALVQGGLAQPGDQEELGSLGGLFEEPLWVFVRAGFPADNFGDLRVARLSIGPEGSGTRALARHIQSEYGGEWPPSSRLELGTTAAQAALLSGEIDAAAFAAAPSAPYVQALLQEPSVRLLAFERSEAIARREEALSAVTLVRGVADVGGDIPDTDVPLVAAISQLVIRRDTHPAIEAVLLDAAQLIHSDSSVFSRAGMFPNAANAEFPLSRQTARFYRDGPSFLRRYLPFGLANFLERAWVLAIPLLTLAFPLVRAAPPLYRWRVRRKIYIWYRDLRGLEAQGRALPPGEARAGVAAELERLQVEISKLEVPLSYTDDLYRLRSHIEFVKQLLKQSEPVTGITM